MKKSPVKRVKPVKPPVNCQICDKTFKSKFNLAKHIKNVHEGIKNKDEDISDYEKIRRRNIAERNEVLKKLNIGKQINSLNSIEKTIVTKKFHCEVCNKSFTKKQNLKKHLRRIHKKAETKCDKPEKPVTNRPSRSAKPNSFKEKNYEFLDEEIEEIAQETIEIESENEQNIDAGDWLSRAEFDPHDSSALLEWL